MSNTYLAGTTCAPVALVITAITKTMPMVITAATASTYYVVGQLITLNVPTTYGMYQANGITSAITAIAGSSITLNVDATQFDPFVVPATGAEQPASLAPTGSRNLYNTTTVPFHSLTNTGN